MRRFGLTPGLPARGARRLALVEALPLDRNRRLLLLRCDGREMLVLVGGGQDLVLPQPEPRA
nr:flagellar biosynthetic protein FliO [Falsiroseomonas frigidaquae]